MGVLYLTIGPSGSPSTHVTRKTEQNLCVQWTACLLDVTCVCEQKGNTSITYVKRGGEKLHISWNRLKWKMWTPTHIKVVERWALSCLLSRDKVWVQCCSCFLNYTYVHSRLISLSLTFSPKNSEVKTLRSSSLYSFALCLLFCINFKQFSPCVFIFP